MVQNTYTPMFLSTGYDLEGVDTTVCEMTIDGPKWTNKPPLCVGMNVK